MKQELIYILIICMLILIYACDSLDDHSVSPYPPNINSSISLTADDSTLVLGDTLNLKIQIIKNSSSKNVMIDFKDGTKIYLKDSNPITDTNVRYVYKVSGLYEISAEFYIENKSENQTINISILPTANVTIEDTTSIVGDTLQIHIHIPNALYNNGIIDFGDYHYIFLNSTVPIIDTTLRHIYESSGNYVVTLEFYNNEQRESQKVNIRVLRYLFDLSLSLNTHWKFDYYFEKNMPPFGEYLSQYGIHAWQVVSYTLVDDDTIYHVRQIRDDLRNDNGNITIVNDTSFFDIVFSTDLVRINWPLHNSTLTVEIPNHKYVNNYPVVVPGSWYNYSVYDDRAGPIQYYYVWYSSHGISEAEKFSLIEYFNP